MERRDSIETDMLEDEAVGETTDCNEKPPPPLLLLLLPCGAVDALSPRLPRSRRVLSLVATASSCRNARRSVDCDTVKIAALRMVLKKGQKEKKKQGRNKEKKQRKE